MILAWVTNLPDGGSWPGRQGGGGWVGKNEVTQAQFEKVLGINPSANKAGGDYPVENMTLDQANEFCAKLTAGDPKLKGWHYTLPSEQQWKFFAGDLPPKNNDGNYTDYANYSLSKVGKTIAVGSLKPNSFGLYDVLGNVSELTSTLLPTATNYSILKGGNFAKGSALILQLPTQPEYYSKPDRTIGFRVVLVPVTGN
jgi:formylglycine-generating enzyme required for sulfatase activity